MPDSLSADTKPPFTSAGPIFFGEFKDRFVRENGAWKFWTADRAWAIVVYRWSVPNGILLLVLVALVFLFSWILTRSGVAVFSGRSTLSVCLLLALALSALDIRSVRGFTERRLQIPPNLPFVIASAIGPDRPNVSESELQVTQCYSPPPGLQLIKIKEESFWSHDTNGRSRACGGGRNGHCSDNGKRCWNKYLDSGCLVSKDWLKYYNELVEQKVLTYSPEKICDPKGWR